MKFTKPTIVIAIAATSVFLNAQVNAQLPGNVTGQAQAAAAAQAQQQVQQQVQNQIQQQAQAQAQQQIQTQIQQQAQTQVQQQIQSKIQSTVQQQVQSQVQLQAQAQIQQQIQARLQQSAGGQVQARLQSEMARAATLAHESFATGRRNLAASSRSNLRLGVGVEGNAANSTNGSARGNAGINLGIRGSSDTRNASSLNSQLRGTAGLVADLPMGTTQADVNLYDSIFGRFNPLRATSDTSRGTATPARSTVAAQAGSSVGVAAGRTNATSQTQLRSNGAVASSQPDLSTRISSAIQQRRGEISLLRDEAIDQVNEQKMRAAEQMEVVLNTFVEAQSHARTVAKAQSASMMNSASPSVGAQGSAGVQSSPSGQIR